MMAKYRKKPVIVEAVKLGWDTWDEMCAHANVGKLIDGKPEGCYINPMSGRDSDKPISEQDEIGLRIPTSEGLMIARQNDWIIRGVKGELYPCKPDIFAATYEPVITAVGCGRPWLPSDGPPQWTLTTNFPQGPPD